MEKYLLYNHASVPTKDIVLDRTYELKELQKKFTLEEIKCLFKPINFDFEVEENITLKKQK